MLEAHKAKQTTLAVDMGGKFEDEPARLPVPIQRILFATLVWAACLRKSSTPLTMKSLKLRSLLFAVAALFAIAGTASAQTNAYDDALHYTKLTWITNGQSFGFGFTPWVLATNGPGSHGFFTTHNVGTAPAPTIASPTNSSTTGSAPGNDNN